MSDPPWPAGTLRALIFPSSTEIAAQIKRNLRFVRNVNLVGASVPEAVLGPEIVADHRHLPPVNAPEFLSSFNALVAGDRIDIVLPAHDDALASFAEVRSDLRCPVLMPGSKTVKTLRSKRATLEVAAASGIPVPTSYNTLEDVTSYPVFVKPDRGQGARGTAMLKGAGVLEHWAQENLGGADFAPNWVCQEFLPGEELTVDCFSSTGDGLQWVAPRTRVTMRAGIATHTSRSDHNLDYMAQQIHDAFGMTGGWFFQVRARAGGEFVLLEAAPRIAGSSGLATSRGVNLSHLSLLDFFGYSVVIREASTPSTYVRRLQSSFPDFVPNSGTLWIDLDDTLLVNEDLNTSLVAVVCEARARGLRTVIITRHAASPKATLERFGIEGLFDEIIHLTQGEVKVDHLAGEGIFIDDSWREREAAFGRDDLQTLSPESASALLAATWRLEF